MIVVKVEGRVEGRQDQPTSEEEEAAFSSKNSSICQQISFAAAQIAPLRSLILLVSFDCIAVRE